MTPGPSSHLETLLRGHNQGSIFRRKRDGKWTAAVSMPDARRVERACPWHDNCRERAKELLRDLLEGRDAELDIPSRRLTLAVWLRSWLADMESRLRPSTARSYRNIIDGHIIPALGTVTLDHLGPRAIQRWQDDMTGSPRSIAHRHDLLRNALNAAVRRRKILRNPMAGVEPPRVGRYEAAVLDADQASLLIRETAGDWYGPLWALLLGSGLRISEALGLGWDDVDFIKGEISVHHQLARLNGAWVLLPWTKGPRTSSRVALPPFVMVALRGHRKAMKLAQTPEWVFVGHVFVTRTGQPPYPWHITEALYRSEASLGLPRVGPHGLRHTVSTLLADAGIPEDVRARRLGHTSAMNRGYTHEAATADRAAADALAATYAKAE